MKTKSLPAINYLIAILTVVSCLISISHNEIYQDGEWANAQWLGQDIVSLILAVPLLLLSMRKGIQEGKLKWLLVNAGILLYFFYTYSFFMYAAELTFLYLFHLPIYGLATIGLVLVCVRLFAKGGTYDLPSRGLRVGIILYLVLIGLMIAGLWFSDILAHLSDPGHRSAMPDGKAPLIIYSLDLALIITLMITAAVLLYRKTSGGYLLTGIILVKTSTLGFALMAMSLSMFLHELNPEVFLIFLWCVIGLLGTLLTVFFLRKLQVLSTGDE